MDSSEVLLVSSAKQGDNRSFKALFGLYGDRVYTFLLNLTGHREDAEDLLQETFLTAYRRLHTLTEDRAFSRWLYAIARNLAVNFIQFAGIKRLFGQHRAPQRVWENIEKQISPKEREDVVVPFLMEEVLRLSQELSELRERVEELEREKQLRELSHLERRFAERFPMLGKVELN